MPRDLLHIAMEHHRAGRLRQAEEGYRALLAKSPEDVEALHMLGVLAEQVGRAGDALPLLERAAKLRPMDAAIAYNLGHAYAQCGRIDSAIEAFTRSLQAEPGQTQTLIDLGLALLARQKAGDAERALGVLWQAKAAEGGAGGAEGGARKAVVQHGLSVALLMSGQIEQAITAARAAITAKPDYAAAHHQLGLALVARRDIEAARESLEKAIELRTAESGAKGAIASVQALAMLEIEAGNLARAETLFRRIVTDDPAHASAWRGLGQVLTRQGKHAAALSAMAEAVRAARTPAPAAPPGAGAQSAESLSSAAARAADRLAQSSEVAELHFALATEANLVAPSRVPAAVVTELFDRYASRFDEHLRDKLGYRVPERVAEAVARHKPAEAIDALDIGCGTGLCGVLLRPMAKSLTGVDLSPAMIEQSRKRNVYDHLHVGDLLATLSAADCQYDLIVAADVLIYHGDLSQIFESAMGALRPGGLFVFSIESTSAERYQLQANRRYGHSRGYIDRLMKMFGWETVSIEEIAIREEKRQPVGGFLAVLRRA
jgi:predicted TPR repeat methyltransferase